MGLKKDKSTLYTAEGIKRFTEFLHYMFIMVAIQIVLAIILIIGFFNEGAADFLYSIFSSGVFIAIIGIFDGILLFWLFWAFIYIVLGRKEINKDHEVRVMIASAFLIPSIVLLAIQIILSKGLIISSSAFYLVNSESNLAEILVQNQFLLAVSIVFPILLGFSLLIFIDVLISKMDSKQFYYAVGMFIISTFTLSFTSLYAYKKFNDIYSFLYKKIMEANIKPTDFAPCPFCNKEISIDSKVCRFCGAKFEHRSETDIDPRFTMEVPKQEISSSQAYSFVKGPSEEQKNKVKWIIISVIIVIVIIALLAIIF